MPPHTSAGGDVAPRRIPLDICDAVVLVGIEELRGRPPFVLDRECRMFCSWEALLVAQEVEVPELQVEF